MRIEAAVLSLVTTSMAEAEACAASQLAKQIEFLRALLSELGFPQDAPTLVFSDCEPAIDCISNGHGSSQRTRHLGLRVMYVSEQVTLGRIAMVHMPTEEMPCDIFTKHLAEGVFRKHELFLRSARLLPGSQ